MPKINVIGLGTAGCNIAKLFKRYPEYIVYQIDSEIKKGKYNYVLPKYNKPEDYEENKNIPKLKTFLRLVKNEVFFIVGGSGMSSSASLVILEQLKHCNVTIIYIKPDSVWLNEKQEKLDRLVFSVLQEYTRSALFDKIYLIDNKIIEEILGDLSFENYYERINETIVSTLHMINVFSNSKSIIDNFVSPSEISRINTFGVYDYKKNKEKLFFSLDNKNEIEYYYLINKNNIKNDKSLFKTIKEQIREKKNKNVKITYGVYSTDYKENLVFVRTRTSKIQQYDNKEE